MNANDLKDVKPPVSLPEFPWLLIVLIVVAAAVLIFCLWYWFRIRRVYPKKVEIKPPWEIAYQRLQDLRQRDLFGQGMAKEHFTELSDITRKYIEGRFDIHTPEMTTEEFLGFVKDSPLVETKHKEILKSFLRFSDMVKFAKYGPSADEAGQSFELAKQFVDETLWPEFQELNKTLSGYLREMTDRVIEQSMHSDASEPEVRAEPASLGGAWGTGVRGGS